MLFYVFPYIHRQNHDLGLKLVRDVRERVVQARNVCLTSIWSPAVELLLTIIYLLQTWVLELMVQIPCWCSTVVPRVPSHWYIFVSIWFSCSGTRFWSVKWKADERWCMEEETVIIIEIWTWVSVNFSCLDNCIRFDTDRYLFFSNSFSKALICAAVKAVLGRFFRSSLLRLASSSPAKKCYIHYLCS